MSEEIFTITSEGKSAHYWTENFGSLRKVLGLLWTVNSARERIPTIQGSDAEHLLLYSKDMFPVCPCESQRLFQPLEKDEYEFLQRELKSGDWRMTHYEVDYDSNHFAMTCWEKTTLETAAGTLDSVIGAYRDARQPQGGVSARHTVNEKKLLAELERALEIKPVQEAPAFPTPEYPQMRM